MFIKLADIKAQNRGLEYFNNKQVIMCNKTGDNQFDGIVSGSDNSSYIVHIDLENPGHSRCSCPYSKGHKGLCKHEIAVYYASIEMFSEKKKEDNASEKKLSLDSYVESLSEKDAKKMLLKALEKLKENGIEL